MHVTFVTHDDMLDLVTHDDTLGLVTHDSVGLETYGVELSQLSYLCSGTVCINPCRRWRVLQDTDKVLARPSVCYVRHRQPAVGLKASTGTSAVWYAARGCVLTGIASGSSTSDTGKPTWRCEAMLAIYSVTHAHSNLPP